MSPAPAASESAVEPYPLRGINEVALDRGNGDIDRERVGSRQVFESGQLVTNGLEEAVGALDHKCLRLTMADQVRSFWIGFAAQTPERREAARGTAANRVRERDIPACRPAANEQPEVIKHAVEEGGEVPAILG